MIELGGNITLAGFSQLDRDTMIIVKKLVGSYVKTLCEKMDDFQSLNLDLRIPESTKNPGKYEIKGTLVCSGQYTAEKTESNLMIAIDKVLKELQASAEK